MGYEAGIGRNLQLLPVGEAVSANDAKNLNSTCPDFLRGIVSRLPSTDPGVLRRAEPLRSECCYSTEAQLLKAVPGFSVSNEHVPLHNYPCHDLQFHLNQFI